MNGRDVRRAIRTLKSGVEVGGLEYDEAKELRKAVDRHREDVEPGEYVPHVHVAPEQDEDGSWKVTLSARRGSAVR